MATDSEAVVAERGSGKLAGRMLLVGGGILASRVLGLLRDSLTASVWGTSVAFAAFTTAFAIPNLLRGLFGEGAFTAAFVPVFSEQLEKHGRARAWQVANRTLSILGPAVAIATLVIIGSAFLLRPLADDELKRATLQVVPWVMPYALLICLSAALAGILNSLHRFAVPAFGQVLINLTMIGGTGLAVLSVGPGQLPSVLFLAAAVLAGGLLQLAWHGWACWREGGRPRFQPTLGDPAVARVGHLLAPALLGAGVAQINVLVDRLLACHLGSLAVGTLYYSQRLVYLSVGLFAVAANVVVLPGMSRAWARGEPAEMLATLRQALRQALFFTLPVFALLTVLLEPIIRLLFQYRQFTAADTLETVWTTLFYLPGIPAFVAAKIVVAPFHASQDTRTPVRIAIVCLLVNLGLNLLLMRYLRQGGLALATSVSSWLNVLLLFYALRGRLGRLGLRRLLLPLARLAVAAGLAAGLCLLVAWPCRALGLGGIPGRLLEVALPGLAGGLAYLGLTLAWGCEEARTALAPIWHRLGRPPR